MIDDKLFPPEEFKVLIENLIRTLGYDFSNKTSFEVAIKMKLKLWNWKILLLFLLFGTIIVCFESSSASRRDSYLIPFTIINVVYCDCLEADALRHLSHISHHQRTDTAHKVTLFLSNIQSLKSR